MEWKEIIGEIKKARLHLGLNRKQLKQKLKIKNGFKMFRELCEMRNRTAT